MMLLEASRQVAVECDRANISGMRKCLDAMNWRVVNRECRSRATQHNASGRLQLSDESAAVHTSR
ncbi:hypothetical protein CWS35_22685 [Bradyrhizobium sp. SK17]|nr:hypothetical protein CWS35_22685 [Bradyrhizobium sp. SK17]